VITFQEEEFGRLIDAILCAGITARRDGSAITELGRFSNIDVVEAAAVEMLRQLSGEEITTPPLNKDPVPIPEYLMGLIK
jgi:hypothetical protein